MCMHISCVHVCIHESDAELYVFFLGILTYNVTPQAFVCNVVHDAFVSVCLCVCVCACVHVCVCVCVSFVLFSAIEHV